MKLNARIALLLVCVLALLPCAAAYAAHPVPDLERTGSVTVAMRVGEQPVPGGSLALYRVGQVAQDDGNFSWTATEPFAPGGFDYTDLQLPGLPAALDAWAADNDLAPHAVLSVNAQGQAVFENLPLGLYLVTQPTPAPGYNAITPFLVTVPYLEGDTYIYDVNAGPKTQLIQQPEPAPPPPTPPEPVLPDTGQLWWPVPVLACGGLALFALGLLLLRRRAPHES